MPRLRVGSVPYLVGRPLDLGLEREPALDFVRAVPARLVDGLRDGSLDVALVSSIELFRRPGYRYLSRLAVAGRGHVGSVQLFLRKPLTEVESVALDPASRTARTLIQVLLAERPGGPPRFLEVEAGQDPREAAADSWLRIGDAALREYLDPAAPPVYNPSEQWCRRTGLPFVFACWIVRPGAPIEEHLQSFVRSAAVGRAAAEALAEEAASEWRLSPADCRDYLLRECVYELGDEMHDALLAFGQGAARIGQAETQHPELIALEL